MEEKWSLRPATDDDLVQVLEIESRVHSSPWSFESFKAELSKPYAQFWVLTDDETDSKIAGYIVFWVMFDDCEILNVATDTPFRGQGMAKTMIRKVADLSLHQGAKKVVLNVRKSNLAAVQLYQGLKFTITHVRKSFYANGEDAYQMLLPLDAAGLPEEVQDF